MSDIAIPPEIYKAALKQKMDFFEDSLRDQEGWLLNDACVLLLPPYPTLGILGFPLTGPDLLEEFNIHPEVPVDLPISLKNNDPLVIEAAKRLKLTSKEGLYFTEPRQFLAWADKAGYGGNIPSEVRQYIKELEARKQPPTEERASPDKFPKGGEKGKRAKLISDKGAENSMHFYKETNQWEVEFQGKKSYVPNREGIRHIALLIENSGNPIPHKDLEGRETGQKPAEGTWESDGNRKDLGALQKEAEQLIADKKRAEEEGNAVEAREAQDKLAVVIGTIRKLTSKKKRCKKENSIDKKRRNRIGKRIESAMKYLAIYDSNFAEHLRKSISGVRSSAPVYRPAKGIEVAILH